MCQAEVPVSELFNIESLSEEEFDQALETAEDIFNNTAASRNSNPWMADLSVQEGISMAVLFTSGKAEKFASARAVSRLTEMQSEQYWNLKKI